MATVPQVRKIRAMVAQLGLDEETYHDLLRAETGCASSKDLDNKQVDRFVKRLRKLGAPDTTVRRSRSKRGNPTGLISPAQLSYIADNYDRLGWTSDAQRMGFNKHCCGRSLPQTHADGTKVLLGQKRMIAEEAAAP